MNDEDRKKLDAIHSSLVGNEALGHEGLIKKVERHEKWINVANLRIASVIGGSVVIIFLVDLIFKR